MSSMRSTFFGLEIGRTGLFVSQRQMDVTGHNIANVETEGYTRQRAITASLDPYSVLMRFAPMERGRVGGGAEVLHVAQIRDKFLDLQIREKASTMSEWQARSRAIDNIEALFNDELEVAGLGEMMQKFFASVQVIKKYPEAFETRTNIKVTAQILCEKFNDYYAELVSQQQILDKQYDAIAQKINSLAENIAEYNEVIFGFELTGEFANDLRDKRNMLLDELSTLVDINYYEVGSHIPGTPGKLMVEIGGQKLVDYKTVNKVEAVPHKTNEIAGEADLLVLKWDQGNILTDPLVNYTTGKLKGLEVMRDGTTDETMGIPYMIEQLNILAKAMVTEFNAVHNTGWTFPYTDLVTGVQYPSVTGIDFFDSAGVTAKTIKLSQDILDSAYNIAMSGEEVIYNDPLNQTAHTGNNDVGLELCELCHQMGLIGNTSFEGFLSHVVVGLANRVAYTDKKYESLDDTCLMLESQRFSISGVSLDEEMTNMITFQHAYNGAARVITAMDEALDKLINGTGRVGL